MMLAACPLQTKAKAANLRVSMELSRAVHGRNSRSFAPGLPIMPAMPRPMCSSHAQLPSKLPPSLLYQPSHPGSKASSHAGCSRSSSSSPDAASTGIHATVTLPGGPGQPTDDRLGLTEVSRSQRGTGGSSLGGSMGESVGGRSSCHSESGYTHTAAHLSFTEIKAHKQKKMAAGLVALRESLLPHAERMSLMRSGSLSSGNSPRDYCSLGQHIYMPSGSIERIALRLPQIKTSLECR